MKYLGYVIMTFSVFMGISCENLSDSDTTPPQISISSPANGATVSDTVIIKALVADNEGVKSVEFYLDGDLLATVGNEPFETQWNTKESTNGTHTLQCKAIDDSDNEALSEAIQVTVSNVLFTANFTGDWLQPGTEGVLFFSSLDGEVLYGTTWSGNATIEVMPTDEMPSFPDQISVTVAQPAWWNPDIIYVTTDYNEEPSTWTYKSKFKYPIGDVTLNFVNVPEHAGYMVCPTFEYGRQSLGGTLPSEVTVNLHKNPDSIYVQLKTTSQGVMVKWIEGMEVGGSYDVDLSDMEATATKEISIPNPSDGTGYYFRLYGHPIPESRYDAFYYLDRSRDYSNLPSTITTNYPDGAFSDFRIRLLIYENSDQTSWWYSSYVGSIPGQTEITDADFEFLDISSNYVRIQPSGTFTSMGTHWEYEDPNGLEYSWNIYGASDDYEVILPQLPQAFTQKYPGISRDDFQLTNATLTYHDGFSSQHEIIELIFKSENYYWDVVNKQLSHTKGNPDLSHTVLQTHEQSWYMDKEF